MWRPWLIVLGLLAAGVVGVAGFVLSQKLFRNNSSDTGLSSREVRDVAAQQLCPQDPARVRPGLSIVREGGSYKVFAKNGTVEFDILDRGQGNYIAVPANDAATAYVVYTQAACAQPVTR